jgi:small subunit ribosomal protein S6
MVTKRVTRKKAGKEPVKTQEINLRDYELVYVIRPDIAEENLNPIIDKVTTLITNKGGVISGTERWGKRKLAYPIKHFLEGNYILGRFKAKSSATKEIEANLQITEEIIRHLLVKIE